MKEEIFLLSDEEVEKLFDELFKRKDNLDELNFDPKTKTSIIINEVELPTDRIVDFDFSGNSDSKYLRVTFIFDPKKDSFKMFPYYDIEDDLEIHWREKENDKAAWEV